MLDISQDAANTLFGLVNVLAIVGGVLVVIGTAGIFWIGSIREHYADKRTQANELATATANEGVAIARRETATANAAAAVANQKAALVEVSAERLKLQIVEAHLALESYRHGRQLTKTQIDTLERVLRSGPNGPLIIKPNLLAAEPTRFAQALTAVFERSGYTEVGDRPLDIVSTRLPGIFLVIRSTTSRPPFVETIAHAFRQAGIPFSTHAEPYVPDTATVLILIGEQP